MEKRILTGDQSSLCGLGQTTPNPVLSTLRYFRCFLYYTLAVAG